MTDHRSPAVDAVRVEHLDDALGIGSATPRLSWITRSDEPGWWQAAYELRVTGPAGETWSTGRVDSDASVLVSWPTTPLTSRERRAVAVRVWGGDDPGPSEWSPRSYVEAGLFEPGDWSARMVAPVLPPAGTGGEPAALVRAEAHLAGAIVGARLYVTAHGLVEAELNGIRVGDSCFDPGWTAYQHRLRYRTYDVTPLVHSGANAIGLHVADGWYRGYLGFTGGRAVYGDRTGVLAQLEVTYADGSRTVVGTDATWRSRLGPVTRADLLQGETHDLRRELPGWSEPGFDDRDWDPVAEVELDPAVLVAPDGPPVRRIQTVPPVAVTRSPSGRILVDFGQNLVGRLRLRLPHGPAGTTVTLRHAEVLEDGELCTRPLRSAAATDAVVLDGAGAREWEPRFTLHGFRYAEVDGWPGELDASDLDAVVLHTDMRRTGTFACSDPLVSRLHENAVWSWRGNAVDVPTDCPQRDERLGWTGDLQVFTPTAAFLYDTAGMLTGWLRDLAVEQAADGTVPPYVPFAGFDAQMPDLGPEAGWGDAAVVVPWVLYQRSGDLGLLERQWPSMTGWVDALARRAGPDADFPGGGFSFGDWLDAGAPDDQPWKARVPWQLVATAYLARSARLVREAALALGRAADADHYATLAATVTAAFRREYVTASGRLAFPAQTAYALALDFDLLDPAHRDRAGQLLAAQVAADGFHIGTGFLGTPVVCDALTDTGQAATAYALLLQRECPSWLYPVTMGATTIWERWNSMLPDGSVNRGDMTSFNHYALGAVADWLHRRVAGLAPADPGYRRLCVAPVPSSAMSWAEARLETPYGPAAVAWTLEGDRFQLEVTVAPSTSAEVQLPDGSSPQVVGAGVHQFACQFQPAAPASPPAAFTPAPPAEAPV